MKLTALVKAGRLFRQEILIDAHSGDSIFNDIFLAGLIDQKSKIENQRNGAFKSFLMCVFGMFLLTNGANITVPGFGINLSDVPGGFFLIAIIGPLTLLIFSYSHLNFQCYDALIEQIVLKKRTNDGFVDPDIVRASLEPFQFFLKIFRKDFNIYEDNRYKISRIGAILNGISVYGTVLILFLALAIPVSYFCFAVYKGTHLDFLGIVFRSYVTFATFVSILILVMQTIAFDHQVVSETHSPD